MSSILIRGPCTQKSRKSEEAKGSPPETALSGRGTCASKPTPGVEAKQVRTSAGPDEQDTAIIHEVQGC